MTTGPADEEPDELTLDDIRRGRLVFLDGLWCCPPEDDGRPAGELPSPLELWELELLKLRGVGPRHPAVAHALSEAANLSRPHDDQAHGADR